MQLIRNDPLRCFRIEVAADSLVQIDEQQTKQERLEFLNYAATFLREAVPAGQQVPEMVPAIMAMLALASAASSRRVRLEGTLDTALQKLQQKAAAECGQSAARSGDDEDAGGSPGRGAETSTSAPGRCPGRTD
jgi:hypothetical protein